MKNLKYTHKQKTEARLHTIINPYRTFFSYSLPPNQQYWTMCSYVHDDNYPQDTELGQILASNLITENQFHGVDLDPITYNSNMDYKNKTNSPIHLYNNDILDQMKSSYANGDFNPGIVNCDMMAEPRQAIDELFLDTFHFLTNVCKDNKILLVANFISKLWFTNGKKYGEDIIEILKSCQFFNTSCFEKKIWKISSSDYQYQWKKNTPMVSILFFKGL